MAGPYWYKAARVPLASAVQLAHRAGAVVIATVRSSSDESNARNAGADHVFRFRPELIERIHAVAPHGVDRIVEVAFGANVATDMQLLALRGSIPVATVEPGASAEFGETEPDDDAVLDDPTEVVAGAIAGRPERTEVRRITIGAGARRI